MEDYFQPASDVSFEKAQDLIKILPLSAKITIFATVFIQNLPIDGVHFSQTICRKVRHQ